MCGARVVDAPDHVDSVTCESWVGCVGNISSQKNTLSAKTVRHTHTQIHTQAPLSSPLSLPPPSLIPDPAPSLSSSSLAKILPGEAPSAPIGIFTSHTRWPVANESFASRSVGMDVCKKHKRQEIRGEKKTALD